MRSNRNVSVSAATTASAHGRAAPSYRSAVVAQPTKSMSMVAGHDAAQAFESRPFVAPKRVSSRSPNRSRNSTADGARGGSGRSRSKYQSRSKAAGAADGTWGRGRNRSNSPQKGSRYPARAASAATLPKEISFNIFQPPVSQALQTAYNCIFGVPFRGSVAFTARIGANEQCQTNISARFLGSAEVRMAFDTPNEPVNVRALSAGYDDGNNARLVVNGVDYCLNRRGFNFALVDPSNMDVQVSSFDTHSVSSRDDERLQDFMCMAARQTGCILLGAVKDDASTCLTQASLVALGSIGMQIPPRDDVDTLQRCVHELPPHRTSQLLNVCAKANAVRCLELLVFRGWNINAHSKHDFLNTPLHDATRRAHLDCIRLLLRMGADRNIVNREGLTADDMARQLHKYSSLDDMVAPRKSHERQLVESVVRALEL